MPAQITYTDLKHMLRNPAVPDEAIAPFLEAVPAVSGAFEPHVRPDPRSVVIDDLAEFEIESALSWGNAMSRWRRQQQYELRLRAGERLPILVSEGDSWFQFPFLIKDVIDHLNRDHLIWSLDAAGDTAFNMIYGGASEYMAGLRKAHADGPVSAFLLSAAGNDVIGEDVHGVPVLLGLLKDHGPGQSAAWHIDQAKLADVLAFLTRAYGKVIADIRSDPAFATLPIILHGYDYAIPGGQPGDPRHPTWAGAAEWLGGPMTQKGILDPAMQREIVKILIDALYDMLGQVAGDPAQSHVHLVNVRDTLTTVADWADEIHGTSAGFSLVAEKFRAVLATV